MVAQLFAGVLCMDTWIFLVTNFSSHFAVMTACKLGEVETVYFLSLWGSWISLPGMSIWSAVYWVWCWRERFCVFLSQRVEICASVSLKFKVFSSPESFRRSLWFGLKLLWPIIKSSTLGWALVLRANWETEREREGNKKANHGDGEDHQCWQKRWKKRGRKCRAAGDGR